MKLVGRCSLQVTEEQVTGGITAAEETRNPTQVAAHQRKGRANPSRRSPQRVSHSRVVVHLSQADNHHDGQAGKSQLTKRFRSRPQEDLAAHSKAQRGKHGRDKDRSPCPKRLEEIKSRVGLW